MNVRELRYSYKKRNLCVYNIAEIPEGTLSVLQHHYTDEVGVADWSRYRVSTLFTHGLTGDWWLLDDWDIREYPDMSIEDALAHLKQNGAHND